jgi:hypothetical protein
VIAGVHRPVYDLAFLFGQESFREDAEETLEVNDVGEGACDGGEVDVD